MAKTKTAEIEVAVAEVVDYLRMTGDFAPALGRVVERKVTAEAARKAGVRVTAKQLQRAADAFRIVNDLAKARDMNRWLKSNGLSLEAFEEHLETNLLNSKFKDQLAGKSPKTKYLGCEEIKSTVREMVYRDWLAKAMK